MVPAAKGQMGVNPQTKRFMTTYTSEAAKPATFDKVLKDVRSSDSTSLFEKGIKNGALKRNEVYANGETLTAKAAKGRIEDVAQKLDGFKKGLGDEFRKQVDVKNSTMQSIITKGEEILKNKSL